MSIQHLRTSDPRDNLEKARRRELVDYAHANGLNDITIAMPAILIRKLLRSKGLVHIRVPDRPLGQPTYRPGMEGGFSPSAVPTGDENVVAVDADEDLARQWAEQTARRAPAVEEPAEAQVKPLTEISRLRQECKARGIKISRRDNLFTLRAKLGGKNAA